MNRGATLRTLKHPEKAYESYRQAMLKSSKQYLDCDASIDLNERENLLTNCV